MNIDKELKKIGIEKTTVYQDDNGNEINVSDFIKQKIKLIVESVPAGEEMRNGQFAIISVGTSFIVEKWRDNILKELE